MVDKLQKEFERATDRYLDQISSSDEEIAVEFQETKDRTSSTTTPATPAATANTPSGPQTKRKKTDSSASTGPKRKPTSIAHTADKRERSPSPVESTAKRRSESRDTVDKAKPDKETKPAQKITRGKTQAATNKSLKNAKNDTTKNVGKQTKRAAKKVQTPSPVRSRTRSQSPKSPSWPPSSPEPVVNSSIASHNADISSDEATTVGKAKGKHKYWKEVFKDKKSAAEKDVKPVKEPPAAKIKEPPPPPPPAAKVKEPVVKPKDKNIKLKETIEKLKAKNELALSDDGVLRAKNKDDKPKEPKEKLPKILDKEPTKEKIEKAGKKPTAGTKNKPKASVKEPAKTKNSKCEYDFDEEENSTMDSAVSDGKKTVKKPVGAPGVKKAAVKNVADIDALSAATEQTLKDINKWLDDTPRFSEFSSASNSPSHFISAEEQDPVGAKIELEYRKTLKMEKPVAQRPKDGQKDPFKRRSSKDPSKLHRRREIQRTIERLQPGKSKGNLLSNMQNANKPEELFPLGPLAKLRESKNSLVVKQDESAPKLSLGTVLDSFGQQHNFSEDAEVVKEPDNVSVKDENTNCSTSVKLEPASEVKSEEVPAKKDQDEVTSDAKPEPVVEKKEVKSENKATPNLSAWFKAFGAPKVQPVVKKKADNDEDKKETVDTATSGEGPSRTTVPSAQSDNKSLPTTTPALTSAEESRKVISPEPDSPATGQPTPRQRRGSTGSSISERSSFSQDLDSSPRMTIDERIGAYPAPYPSPLHRSPASASPVMASPRQEEPQRPYPTLNGSIRVGFYQDTVSTKSSPDKSCSPRDQPHSPYQHYSVAEHVYTPPNTIQSGPAVVAAAAGGFSYSNPPYYSQNPPPAYATSTNHSPPIYADRPHPAPYYDTTKPLTDQYNAKVPPAGPTMGYQAQEEPVNSPEPEYKAPVPTPMDTSTTAPPPVNTNISEYRQQIRIPDKQPTMFPVKKRLYSDIELSNNRQQQQLEPLSRDEQDMTMDQSNQLQPHHENSRDSTGYPATNRSIEMGLMTGRQLNLGAQPRSVQPQTQLGSPSLQDMRPNSRGEVPKQFMPADTQMQQQRSVVDAQPSAYARPDSRGMSLALNKPYEGQMDLAQAHLHHGTAHHHHHHQPATSRELELNMQLPGPNQSLPMRQLNYPTTTANVYSHSLTAHDTSNAYSLNMTHRSLEMSANTSREQEERKLDMSKLTNMGYLAPNAPSPQSYQSLNYTNRPPSRPTDVHTSSSNVVPPGQVPHNVTASSAEHMNLSMRYPDSRMSMNYHRPSPMEVSRPDTGQSNLPMTSVPNSEMLQVPQVSRSRSNLNV